MKEIRECEDKYCPFYPFRFADMDWQIKKLKKVRDERKRQNTHI